jgi:hypothetical protein
MYECECCGAKYTDKGVETEETILKNKIKYLNEQE